MNKNIRRYLTGASRESEIPSLESWIRSKYGFSYTKTQYREALSKYMKIYNVSFYYNCLI